MTTFLTRHFTAVLALLSLSALPASAQLFRAYLSIDGNDANPCTATSPCRLLPAALTAVASGGEIWMLDSANFNTAPVAINKGVTIVAIPGVLGSVVALGGNAINVTTTSPVTLRNLNILPFTGNNNQTGVSMSVAGNLTLANCSVLNFNTGHGLDSVGGTVEITDSAFRNNDTGALFRNGARGRVLSSVFNGGNIGVYSLVEVGSNTVTKVTIARSAAFGFAYGFIAETYSANGITYLDVADSTIEGSTQYGVSTFSSVGVSQVTLSTSMVTEGNYGVVSQGTGARAILSGNTVSHNIFGLFQFASSLMESSGNNTVRNNSNNTSGTITPTPQI